jgi:hypothetical protein
MLLVDAGEANHSMFWPLAVIVWLAFVPEFWQKGPALFRLGTSGFGLTVTVNSALRGPSQLPLN